MGVREVADANDETRRSTKNAGGILFIGRRTSGGKVLYLRRKCRDKHTRLRGEGGEPIPVIAMSGAQGKNLQNRFLEVEKTGRREKRQIVSSNELVEAKLREERMER